MTVLDRFSAPTRAWFDGAFDGATPAQLGAWQSVSEGHHTLVVAPTGSGKTLAAFLWAIDRMVTEERDSPTRARGDAATGVPRAERPGTRVLYISPLKALAVDVERNLRAPLVGITQTARRLEVDPPDISVGVRSGDTPPDERRRLARTPPDILITTPESLYLMLTSAARAALGDVHTVIVDEVHAVAGTKRGAHLAVTLERLDGLLDRPAQRIGLSATVRPRDEVARFLGGAAPVRVVAPPSSKVLDLSVQVPVADLDELGSAPDLEGSAAGAAPRASIWPHLEERVVDLVAAHRSTIVFANSRRIAERLTARLNEIWAGRIEDEVGDDAGERARSSDESDPAALRDPRDARPPAEILAQSGLSAGAPALLARAHHGSVSKEQRATIEDDLKTGRLPCVVATSSLELGIDMGAVDLVVQVAAPPSVASGLQRVGRAGHQVGEVSHGVVLPNHRADLVQSAVAAERMLVGGIESIAVPANPLDVLAQHVVSAAAVDALDVDEWYDLVRRSAPFAGLPRSAYDATLDLLAGRYPSDEFAELRPRIVWDRVAGTVTGRPGAQRLAVTSGGTIPDRGMFGVFLVGEPDARPNRVGELDEEMVYESRVGDVFALGTTSWRIADITHDRVLVTPAYGQPGRLPFWKGDALGRPYELGAAMGAFVREVDAATVADARDRCTAAGLDEWATDNLTGFIREQREATGHVPHDLQLLVERSRDELGDWRVLLHSPYGLDVHAPWALAVAARVRERHGVDGSATASDDGIVVRLPDSDAEPPGAELFVFDPDELDDLVVREVGGSALFASRFRECAARALLLPRRDPGRRSPLWQQRQRAAQLLEVARQFPQFPIVLEAVRECLQDVYDVPALLALMRRLESGQVRIADLTTTTPSPFARSLLFGYVGQFVYEGDNPLAERRAAALSLDPELLAELLGRVELRELLDADVLTTIEHELQRLVPDRAVRDVEGVADLLRLIGPLTRDEVVARCVPDAPVDAWLAELARAWRALEVAWADTRAWAAIEDAARLRDALGTPLPIGVPDAFIDPVDDPMGDLVARWARTHGPFVAADVAGRYGLGVAVVTDALRRLAGSGRVVEGEFSPHVAGSEWCDAEVLRRIRRRSLAALRREVEPVEPAALGRFLPAWQHVADPLRGVDGVASVIDQLAGLPLPASALEPLVLGSRVARYDARWLDELTASGEVLWQGHGALPGNDGWVSLHFADTAPLTLAPVDPVEAPLVTALVEALGDGASFYRDVATRLRDAWPDPLPDGDVTGALWDAVWAGLVGNDTLAPLRALVGTRRTTPRRSRPPTRARTLRTTRPRGVRPPSALAAPPTVAGRWFALPTADRDATVRAHATAEQLLARYGVVTRGAVAAEEVPGGFAGVYRVLSAFEESGRVRRGYVVEGLGAAQFAVGGAVDRLRGHVRAEGAAPPPVVLAATDPANPYGAALPWPSQEGGHRPGRKAGALVVLVDGDLACYLERGGRTVLTFTADDDVVVACAEALAAAVRRDAVAALTIEKVDGEPALGSSASAAFEKAGFTVTPRGLRLRPTR